MTDSTPPRPAAFPPGTRVRWRVGRATLTGTVTVVEWRADQATYRYTLGDVAGAPITTAHAWEPALQPAPTE